MAIEHDKILIISLLKPKSQKMLTIINTTFDRLITHVFAIFYIEVS